MYDIPREREVAIRRRVRRRVLGRTSLVLNFALYCLFGLFCVVAFMFTGWMSSTPFVVLGFLWTMVLVAHAVLVFALEWMERAVTSELEKERAAYYRAVAEPILAELSYEKRKRVDHLTISDDGELIDYDEDYSERRRKRG